MRSTRGSAPTDTGFGVAAWGPPTVDRCAIGARASVLTSLHADYLWQAKILQRTVQLDWHAGGGVRALYLVPAAFLAFEGGLGVRFYF